MELGYGLGLFQLLLPLYIIFSSEWEILRSVAVWG